MGPIRAPVQDARSSAMDMMTEPTKPQQDTAETVTATKTTETTETKGPEQKPGEIGGPKGPEPTRYGDWEFKGRCSDF
ncbi:Protein of unknown function [Azospirillum oryzae]|uniref:DUF1674 domain-containing protein n=2 Tax=Azospirillum oryzae TaxID=286727 RepID=A0A1X7GH59_9PROT|nr:Protein of unknown function [Azospirillum oryzae]